MELKKRNHEEINMLTACYHELQELECELETQSKLMELYDHATLITAIVSISLSAILAEYYLLLALSPLVIYLFLKFLKHRKLKRVAKCQIYIVKHLFKRNYGL